MTLPIYNLDIGDRVKFGSYLIDIEKEEPQPIIWQIADKSHTGYPTDAITLVAEKIIDLRAFDAKEPTNSDSERKSYGNNRYKDSNIRQWLNNSEMNNWYVPQHSADASPTNGATDYNTGYDNMPGFLYFFTEQELSKILDTTLIVAKNTVTDGGGSETVTDKVFLLSNTEVGVINQNDIAEGSLLPLFNDDASRMACLTQQAFNNTKSSSKPSAIGDKWQWLLRTPYTSNSSNVRFINANGALQRDYACYGCDGIRPALNLSPETFVSDGIGYDGCYSVADKYIITLDKPITVATTDYLMQCKFNPKINNTDMTIKKVDAEKIIYEAKGLSTDKVDLSIQGKDAKIDKIAYAIS